jgi:TctA family transporter
MATIGHGNQAKNLWQRLNGPLKIGLAFALLGIVLTIIGIFRDPTTPVTTWSLGIGSLISGVTWGLVSWAIATAAVEVEQDVRQAETESGQTEATTPADEPG